MKYRSAFAPVLLALTAAAIGGCGPSDTVTLDLADTYGYGSGRTKRIAPEANPYVRARILVGPDGATEVEGVYHSNGTITFEGVPAGENVLELAMVPSTDFPGDLPYVFRTPQTRRKLRFGERHWARAGVEETQDPVALSVSLTGIEPWADETDDFLAISRNADMLYELNGAIWPDAGATTLTDRALDLSADRYDADGSVLLDAASGDDFSLVQTRLDALESTRSVDPWDPWYDVWVDRPIAVASFGPQTLNASDVAVLDGAMSAAPTQPFALDFRGSSFAALRAQLQLPGSTAAFVNIDAFHEPGTDANYFVGEAPPVFTLSRAATSGEPIDATCYADYSGSCDPALCPDGCSTETTGVVDPGDLGVTFDSPRPYSTPGTDVLAATYWFSYEWEHPTMLDKKTVYTRASVMGPLEAFDGQPIELTLGPPRNIRIDGNAFAWPEPGAVDQYLDGVGLTPVVTFDAPSTGEAEHYVVDVVSLDRATGLSGAVRRTRTVARVVTLGTSVRIPPDVLQEFSYYCVLVTAVAGAGDLEDRFDWPRGVVERRTSALIGPFRP